MSEVVARVDELEVKIAFQDDLLNSLNRSVSDLSREVSTLRAELVQLRMGLESMRGQMSPEVGDEPPPHY